MSSSPTTGEILKAAVVADTMAAAATTTLTAENDMSNCIQGPAVDATHVADATDTTVGSTTVNESQRQEEDSLMMEDTTTDTAPLRDHHGLNPNESSELEQVQSLSSAATATTITSSTAAATSSTSAANTTAAAPSFADPSNAVAWSYANLSSHPAGAVTGPGSAPMNPYTHMNMNTNMNVNMSMNMAAAQQPRMNNSTQSRHPASTMTNANLHGQTNALMAPFGMHPYGQGGGFRGPPPPPPPPHSHSAGALPFGSRMPYLGAPHDNRMHPPPMHPYGQQFSFPGMPHHHGHGLHSSPQHHQQQQQQPQPQQQQQTAGSNPTVGGGNQQDEMRRRQMQANNVTFHNHNPMTNMNSFFNPRGGPPPSLRPPGFGFGAFPMLNLSSIGGPMSGGTNNPPPNMSANPPPSSPFVADNDNEDPNNVNNTIQPPGIISPSKAMPVLPNMPMHWPPSDDKEYTLSEIISSLTAGHRLSPESSRGRARGRPKGTGKIARNPKSAKSKGIMSLTKTGPDGTIVPIHSDVLGDDNGVTPVWYSGSAPLGMEEDQFWLSELQVFLRSNLAEAFGATELDIAAPMHGRNKPIALGQVGIRCMYCKDQPPLERGLQSVSYPSLVSGIYNSVQTMFRLHFDTCPCMPDEIRQKIETLRSSSSSRGGRKQYWIDSATRLGLVDTPHGIHFARDPSTPLPPLDSVARTKMMYHDDDGDDEDEGSPTKLSSFLSQEHSDEIKRQKEEAYPLVLPEDKDLISDQLYLTLEQMEPCKLMDADRVGCYKGRELGFRGLACKWCVGQAGCGRYFPASEASLSQTTTSQTVLNHVRNCRRCPVEIRDKLELMRDSKYGLGGKKGDKPKHGGRKVFFHRLWCRIQCVPMDKFEDMEAKIGRQKGAKNRRTRLGLGKKRKSTGRDSDVWSSSSDSESDDSDVDTESEDDADDAHLVHSRKKSKNTRIKVRYENNSEGDESVEAEDTSQLIHGCVPLTRKDDPDWLSSLMCFVRSDMVEMFSVDEDEVEEGLVIGQVGVRCTFCAKLPVDERPDGHAYFPSSVSTIYQSVSDLQRRHFMSCSELSDEAKKSFKNLQGFGAKAESETQQYWIDSARELGVANMDNNVPGIRFYRDPEKGSPADAIYNERHSSPKKKNRNSIDDPTCLVRNTDQGTDQFYLLMKQFRPCRFKNSDRRGGTGVKGRDRVLDFPGLACKHCSFKNNLGRYFPMSAKILADNTSNQLLIHIEGCTRCPESIKSSLAYLSHRSLLQKSEWEEKWKFSFFKSVWDRLHVNREWSKNQKETGQKVDESDEMADDNNENESAEEDGNEEEEEVDEMVKAAAQWLTKREPSSKGRFLPTTRKV